MTAIGNSVNTLENYWMPFTANRSFKTAPRQVVAAEGMHYIKSDGERILDSSAGLWCVNAGHCREPIIEAIRQAAGRLDFAPPFQVGHPGPFRLAERIAALMPEGLNRIFFTNSGSESVETALKIALAYHQARGEGRRLRLIGRERGYHGVNFGGISVGGIVTNRRAFGQQLPFVDHLPHTFNLSEAAFSKGQPKWGGHLADDLERLIALHGAETIAAVIVEPIACSTGVLVPPVGYLERLREITKNNGILLIFDEVITAFGRLGTNTAAERFGVTPDIITMAKGLTNGAVPMGAVAVRQDIHDTFMTGPEHVIELFHGYTYSGHPLACAAGLAALDLYDHERLFEQAAKIEPIWQEAVHSLRDHPHVIDIRDFGLVAAIELKSGEAPALRGTHLMRDCFEHGLLIRLTGDTIALSPPLIITEAQIDEIISGLSAALKRLA
jgi:beta-alanine--pyruvate transaminase